ncbi:MAG: GNAT family N-acetyltransferase [Rheinheimera sp.]|mgnify:CR=1 FL=1|uniref:GNAT family N-acetyltransferase n=1 Tax=Arsukibacterium sp. UBA3155 TaxID=1946058 RepID=UPI000C8A9EA0|nr:GNAT family N-acetyltransferase [Arsukibacterium sp. UBA3155]MAD77470.1 GNAT family N-acetyltransferase [Rheinheimera sp.]|tara:strand:+ start:34617 stop:35192 length:576 start_codon:yes stop_codon:yes gene_type:complete
MANFVLHSLTVPASRRLSFRLLSANDAALLFEVDQDEEVMRYLNGGKRTSMQQITEIFLPRMAQYRNPQRGYGIWQVCRTVDNAYMGWVLIRPIGFNTATPSVDDVELGWRFKRLYWGQGYASEAAAAVAKEVVANNNEVQYVSAITTPDNAGSIGVMRKLGMRFVKRYMHQDALGEVDAVLYRKKIDENY